MTRMTGPDCVVMCNLINKHTHTHTQTHTHWQYIIQFFSVAYNSDSEVLTAFHTVESFLKFVLKGIVLVNTDKFPIFSGGWGPGKDFVAIWMIDLCWFEDWVVTMMSVGDVSR